jgi:hypothetical protein
VGVNIAFVAPDKASAQAAFLAQNAAYATPLPNNVKTALNTLLGTLADTPELPGYAVGIYGTNTHFQIVMRRIPADEAAPAAPNPVTVTPAP